MLVETEDQKREIQRWSRFAIQLIGAADSGTFDHITTGDVVQLQHQDIFASIRISRSATRDAAAAWRTGASLTSTPRSGISPRQTRASWRPCKMSSADSAEE